MRTLFAEVRHAVRVLARNRTTTLVSFVTVALAIGATTAIFTVADGLLLRRLPYPDPNGLVHIGRQFADEVGESTRSRSSWRWLRSKEGRSRRSPPTSGWVEASTWWAADHPIASWDPACRRRSSG